MTTATRATSSHDMTVSVGLRAADSLAHMSVYGAASAG